MWINIPNKPKVFNFNFIFSIIFSNNFPQISQILLENSSKKNQRKIFCKFLNTLGLFGIKPRDILKEVRL
jgi:hypothetical protein